MRVGSYEFIFVQKWFFSFFCWMMILLLISYRTIQLLAIKPSLFSCLYTKNGSIDLSSWLNWINEGMIMMSWIILEYNLWWLLDFIASNWPFFSWKYVSGWSAACQKDRKYRRTIPFYVFSKILFIHSLFDVILSGPRVFAISKGSIMSRLFSDDITYSNLSLYYKWTTLLNRLSTL